MRRRPVLATDYVVQIKNFKTKLKKKMNLEIAIYITNGLIIPGHYGPQINYFTWDV